MFTYWTTNDNFMSICNHKYSLTKMELSQIIKCIYRMNAAFYIDITMRDPKLTMAMTSKKFQFIVTWSTRPGIEYAKAYGHHQFYKLTDFEEIPLKSDKKPYCIISGVNFCVNSNVKWEHRVVFGRK